LVTYVAMLDVPRQVVEHLGRLLAAHHRRIGTPRDSRVLGPLRQGVLVLRRFRERGCVHCPARDASISQATEYRHLHVGIDALTAQAPGLRDPGLSSHTKGGVPVLAHSETTVPSL
jgi:hypothetical protein